MDAAECIGCGACVAACPNGAASLFTSAKDLAPAHFLERGSSVIRTMRLGRMTISPAKAGMVLAKDLELPTAGRDRTGVRG